MFFGVSEPRHGLLANLGSQPEIHGDGVIHIDRIAAIRRRPKPPAADGVARGVAESVRQILDDLDVVDRAVFPYDSAQNHSALHARLPRRHPIPRQQSVVFLWPRSTEANSGT